MIAVIMIQCAPAYCMGRFDPKKHRDFVLIPAKYADREGMYMRRDAYDAFLKMTTKAQEAGIVLTIRSAARNFDYQKGIWERKWRHESTSLGHRYRSQLIQQ